MPLPKLLPSILPFSLLGVPWLSTYATYTNSGLTLLAAPQYNGSASALLSYVAIGLGTATLSAGVTNGVPTTSLSVNALAANVAAGQSLIIIYQTYTDTVTCSIGASVGATSIPINSWTPSYSYPSGSGLVNRPALTDIALQNEQARVAISAAVQGANPGEMLASGYFDPTTAINTYLEVGYYGGSAATSTPGSGVLVARDIMWWPHSALTDSFTCQIDGTL